MSGCCRLGVRDRKGLTVDKETEDKLADRIQILWLLYIVRNLWSLNGGMPTKVLVRSKEVFLIEHLL